ncbi:S-layer homology domain-containing protein [Lysinibacillus sp. 54212]|uniref:S-layer homology domain-containing protein n=1 Tax=Lysinibacillus sp. 54212 TaxID=3119829 RepID=UPI002FC6ACB7
MAKKNNNRKFFAASATAALVASAIVPVSAAYNDEAQIASWAQESVQYVTDAGFMKGSDDNFNPTGTFTRAEAATIAVKVLGLDNSKTEYDKSFTDVKVGQWFFEEVGAAAEAGIVNGLGDGNFNPNGKLSRQDAAIILAKIYGLDVANADVSVLDQFTDKASIAGYATKHLAALVEADVIKGANGKINPTGDITRQELAVMLTKSDVAFGITAEEALEALEAAQAELVAAEKALPEVKSITKETAEAANKAALEAEAAIEATQAALEVAEKLEAITAEEAAKVQAAITAVQAKVEAVKEAVAEVTAPVGEATVKSVTAVNGTTVVVTFNTAVVEAEAEAADAVTLDGVTFTGQELSEDGKTLTLTTNVAIDVKEAVLTVNAITTKADAEVKTAKYVSTITYKDTVAPTLVSTSATGKEAAAKILVKFDEKLAGMPIVYVNGVAANAVVNGDTVEVTPTTPLKAGETATIKLTNVKDVAGNFTTPNPLETTVTAVGDTVAPKIVAVEAKDDNKVAVTYDEAVASVKDGAYLSVAGNKVATASGSEISEDGKVVTYTFDTSALTFKDGKSTADLYLPADEATDAFGNVTNTEYKTAVTFAKDTVKPTVVSSQYKDGAFVFEFSEAVTIATKEIAYALTNPSTGYVGAATTLTDSDAAFTLSNEGKTLTVKPTVALSEGTYKVSFDAGIAKDTSNAQNEVEAYATTLTVSATTAEADKTAPEITVTEGSTGVATVTPDDVNKVFKVQYTVTDAASKLNFDSIQDQSNYTLDGKALPAGTVITTNSVDGSEVNAPVTVTIAIPYAGVPKDIDAKPLTITGIKDAVGNAVSTIVTTAVTLTDKVAPELTAATLYTADGTIVLTASEALDVASLAAADLEFFIDGATVATTVTTATLVEGTGANVGKYVLTLDATATAALKAATTVTMKTVEGALLEDLKGNTLKAGATITVTVSK